MMAGLNGIGPFHYSRVMPSKVTVVINFTCLARRHHLPCIIYINIGLKNVHAADI